MPEQPSLTELESALDHISASPTNGGKLEMISAAPLLASASSWKRRRSMKHKD